MFAGLAAFPLSGQPLAADGHALTLKYAQRLAVERSRQLFAQDSTAAAARELAVAAAQLPDPTLRLGIDNLPVNGDDQFSVTRDFMTMRRIGVMQELTRLDKRELRAERFEQEAQKSIVERGATLAAIQRDTALAWLDRYYAEAQAAIITEQARQAEAEIDVAESAYRAGRGTQADVLAARLVLVGFADRASEVDRRIAVARINLARWIGEHAREPLAGTPALASIGLNTGSLESQLRHHPQLALLAKQQEIATTEVKLAQANKKADWSVELAYSQRGAAYSNMISVGVSVPLQWDQRNRQDREVAAKLAAVDQAGALREEALRAHVAEIRTMLAEWRNGLERQGRYQRDLLPLASARTQALIAAYRGGKSALGDVLMGRRNEIEVRMQALQLESETARMWAQLNFLIPEEDLAHLSEPAIAVPQKEPK
jgi:outer membrane protein TolC